MQLGLHHALFGSLLVNMGFVAAWCWSGSERNPQSSRAAPPVMASAVKPADAAVPVKTPPFHWSQIETTDFAAFVHNLRDIGCPEQTLRDIVAGELEEIYALKRHEASQQAGGLSAAVQERLKAEQGQLFARLITPAAAVAEQSDPSSSTVLSVANSSAPPAPFLRRAASAAPPLVPAAYVYGSEPGTLITQQDGGQVLNEPAAPPAGLSPAAATALQEMRADFAQNLEAAAASQTGEDYLAHWNQARQQADERFRLLFGGEAFVRAQIQAAQEAATAAAK